MNQFASAPSREDVLDAFAVEPNHERNTLERYLRDYPQYAAELVDLSRELSRVIFENKEPLSAEDQTLIEGAWRRHLEAAPKAIVDPFRGTGNWYARVGLAKEFVDRDKLHTAENIRREFSAADED